MKEKWHKTPFPGVRFRKHPTRKHGVKRDAYFQIRYQKDGRRVEEALGWASAGMSAKRASVILEELRESARTGKGETSLAEKRAKAEEARRRKMAGRVTFGQFWKDTYLPQAKTDKTAETIVRERSLFKCWLGPVLGALPFSEISVLHIERVKSKMTKAGQSARSIEYCLAVARQVFNEARRRGVYMGENPVRQVKKPKVDNKRIRFLTPAEAEDLLSELKTTDATAWEMALLSLHCGLRAGEIFRLTRADLNFDTGTIAVKQAKSGRGRFAYMTGVVKEMLEARGPGEPDALLFPGPGGRVRREVPKAFRVAVKKLEFNLGRMDRKDLVVFHTCRHSFASWLAQKGVDSREIQRLLGHRTAAMTARYSHLAPDSGREALAALEGMFNEAKKASDPKEAEGQGSAS